MSVSTEPELVLYDLASTVPGVSFSPSVWKIRLMLNYKKIAYRTVFVEFPDIESVLGELGIPKPERKYTVPAIHHLPTNTKLMDSDPIAIFLEQTYPEPALVLASSRRDEIEQFARSGTIGGLFRTLMVGHEPDVLCPRSQEFFVRTRERFLGHPLAELLAPGREEAAWEAADADLRRLGEMLQSSPDSPFALGAPQPSMADFWIVGVLRGPLIVYPSMFYRMLTYPGFREVYEACAEWMVRTD